MHAAVRPKVMAGVALAAASLIAVTPIASPPDLHRVAAAVRLASGDGLLGDLTSLGGLSSDLGSLANLGGLSSLVGDLGNLGGLTDALAGLNLGGLANIPYNVFADIVNIPYNEINAIGIYADALGPANQIEYVMNPATGALLEVAPNTPLIGSLAGDIPLGISGTGSWWMESLGNTWGWDDGNFGQLLGIANMLVPFPQFETPFAEELQLLLQAEIVDGGKVGCEFECADVLGYLGNWFKVPLTQLLSGYTYPTVLQGDVGNPTGVDAIWSGQHVTLNPLLPFESLAANLTGSPANNPIMLPDLGTAITNIVKLSVDLNYQDFNPLVEGSFLYWGAPTLYSVPAGLGGIVQSLTGIPNQFGFPADQPLGAEPTWGPTASLPQLVTGLPQGFEYLLNGDGGTAGAGLLGYLNPEIYLQALSNDVTGLISSLQNPASLLNDIPFATFLLGGLFGPSTLLGNFSSLVPNAGAGLASMTPDLAMNLNSLLPSSGADLASMLSPNLAADLSALLTSTGIAGLWDFFTTTMPSAIADLDTQLAADFSTLLGSDLATNLASTLGPNLATDLSSLLASSGANTFATVIPDLALQLLTSLF